VATVLFLAHRLPFPPDKGDKIHGFHVLKRLTERHRVLLATFVDEEGDEAFVPAARELCAELQVCRLRPRAARLRSAVGLLLGEPLTVTFYRHRHMRAWVDEVRRQRRVDAIYVYSSTMLQYARHFDLPTVIDFTDVDSAKWSEYGRSHRWPMSWVYRREGRLLAGVERSGAARARWSLFATEREADLFRNLAPESAQRVGVLGNGVDCAYFAPDAARASPFAVDELPLVFVGTMDYWPNIDGVVWFVREVLPQLRSRWPALRLHVVGRNPPAAVRALACDAVVVTGAVPDVRPYVQHAAVMVAPLRITRGIQNKVLEAMALARPVVAAAGCVQAIDATPGEHLVAAHEPADYVREIDRLLRAPEQAAALGCAARAHMLGTYTWRSRLDALEGYLGAETLAWREAA
jgi:sugar transferase (PEP-CTERM/EpsH1 system associated)